MSDKKQLTQMSQFSIVREMPGEKSVLHSTPTPSTSNNAKKQKPSELKFKIEPIGIQPEDDDDLETCPSRTRSSWPHQIVPWWKPADRYEKPPYSYATLIAHAILTSKDGRLTLSDIYKWISEAYPYYKRGQKGWQNSIRHNLSLNKKWFIKVDRRPTQAHPGKGGYWTLQMNMEKVFVDNLCQAGGHSRRHHDMGMYSSLSTQYYRSSGSENDQDSLSQEELSMQTLCPNIHITRPEDYEVKKNKSTVSAPRIRNMSSQEKKSPSPANAPKTDPKNFIIRFNPHDSTTNTNKRKRDAPRPPPKAGKRRNPVEPGSSTAEDDDDSAVDVGSCSDSHTSKKRKSTTKAQDSIIDTITASQYNLSYPSMSYNQAHNLTKPSDVIGSLPASGEDMIGFNHNDFWMYDEPEQKPSNLLLTSEYPPLLYDVEAQNILHGLQSTTVPQQTQPQQPANIISHHPDMKTIDLQTFALEKNIHYPDAFAVEEFSDPNSNLFISDLSSYNLDQYVDFSANMMADDTTHLNQPSDVLLEDDATMNTYWPETSPACYMNFDANNANTMPFVKYD